MISQMSADDTLMIWQANRHLSPEGRISLIEKMEGWSMSDYTPHPGLLPCPFCGQPRIFLNEPSESYRYGSINCPACLACMPGEVRDQSDLINCWNDRAPGWQAIETAPKDGTTVLVSVHGGHDGPYWVIFWNGNEWESSESGDFLQFHTELDYVWVTPPTPPEVQS